MRLLASIVLTALVAGASAAKRPLTARDFDFFPNADPLAAALLKLRGASSACTTAPPGAHKNCTLGDCSFPGAWWKANQTEYKVLGNGDGSSVLKIAVSDYFPKGPTLYVVPRAWCDTEGATADGSFSGLKPRNSKRRALLGDGDNGPVVSVHSGRTCGVTGEEPVSFRVGNKAAVVAERVDGGAYAIPLPNNLDDGETCIEVYATYDTSRVVTSPDYREYYQPLGDTTLFSRKVCLYKLTRQADAELKFDMCTSNKFTLNITDISPLPVNISRWDEPLPHNLFRPMIKLWGRKVRELDGKPSGHGYDESSSRNEANYIAKFFPIAPSYAGESLTFPLSDKLQEGYYEVSAVVSVVTGFPALTNLTGLNQITQDDKSGTASNVTGLWEAASRMIHNSTLVGVQKNSTLTTLSAISSSSHSPGQPVQAGDKIVLNWKFRGIGSATCTHDGAPLVNAPNSKCASPLTLTAKDFGEGDTRHEIEVTFTDVCGRVRTAGYEYTQQGVKTLTAAEVLNTDGSIRIVGGSTRGDRASSGTGGRGLAAAAAAAAGGALALLAL